jgi:hypothetical protein
VQVKARAGMATSIRGRNGLDGAEYRPMLGSGEAGYLSPRRGGERLRSMSNIIWRARGDYRSPAGSAPRAKPR